MTEDSHSPEIADDRVFLVVVDDTEEMKVALRFACGRARNTNGRVALLYVIEGSEFQHWMSVGDLMREEARSEGEQLMQRLATQVIDQTGSAAWHANSATSPGHWTEREQNGAARPAADLGRTHRCYSGAAPPPAARLAPKRTRGCRNPIAALGRR